jgi:hypothetical protein
MSKFHLSQELTDLISNAVNGFALRLETELHINKEDVLAIWNQCSDDVITAKKPVKKTTEAEKQKHDAAVVKQLVAQAMPERRFALRKNPYGQYEHKDTGFVFDPQTKEVFGKQVEDQVKPLRVSDIEVCKQYGFKYRMPETFDDEVVEIEAELSDVDDLDGDDSEVDE